MFKRLLVLLAAVAVMVSASGCMVAESTYLKKVGEGEKLSGELAQLQQAHNRLVLENSDLKGRYNSLKSDSALVADEKKQLEQLLQAKSDTLTKSVSELRQQVVDLKVENSRLNEDIARLQKAKEEKVKEVSGTYEQLLSNMKNEISKGQVTISELKGKLTVNLEAAILFDSGKADVMNEGVDVLGKLVETLKGVKERAIRIEGHTDNVQISGGLTRTFPTNWELSAARAINVARYLQSQGVDPANLSAAAFAEHKPVADNGTREGRAKNRRIEITLIAKD